MNPTETRYRVTLANGERIVIVVTPDDPSPYHALRGGVPIIAYRTSAYGDETTRVVVNPANILFFEEVS